MSDKPTLSTAHIASLLADTRRALERMRTLGGQVPDAVIRTIAQVTPSRYAAGTEPAGEIRSVLMFLESEFGTDGEYDTLIAGSFLANLPRADDPHAEALELLGSKLRAELERQWRGEGISAPQPAKEFINRLVTAEPSLENDLREHLDFYDELLEHIFLGEVTAKVVEWVQSEVPAHAARARTIVNTVEKSYGENYEVDELIAASFVENLPRDDSVRGVVDMFGPRLRAEYERQSSLGG